MDLSPTLELLIAGESLDDPTARALMRDLLSGHATEVQIAGVLIALRMKGVTGKELASFATELREEARPIPDLPDDLVDTCGTGGGAPSFNLSTGAAIIAAAAGVKVAKHGNRAVTSSCGSADVLEALGVQIAGDAAEASRQLKATGLCFLFAPYYHPGMKHVGAVRRALGVRSVFNMLGPMVDRRLRHVVDGPDGGGAGKFGINRHDRVRHGWPRRSLANPPDLCHFCRPIKGIVHPCYARHVRHQMLGKPDSRRNHRRQRRHFGQRAQRGRRMPVRSPRAERGRNTLAFWRSTDARRMRHGFA